MASTRRLRSWYRSPYGLLAAFLALTLGPSIGLVWLGWRLLDQDRALEKQRIDERRERAADQVVASLQRTLQASELDLAQRRAPTAGDDALMVEFRASELLAYPSGSLLFRPQASVPQDVLPNVYRQAESYEFQRRDYERAIRAFQPLARSPDPTVRAGALLRIARNQRKAGQLDSALRTYSALTAYDKTSAGGLPAGLVARWARCDLLAGLGRRQDLAKEAADLYGLLQRGHWRLSQAEYDVVAEEAAAWLGVNRDSETPALALAEAVTWLAAQAGRETLDSGRASSVRQNRLVTILWTRGPDGLRALVAGPQYGERKWLPDVERLADTLRVTVALSERTPGAAATSRSASVTGLPWPVLVANRDAKAELEEFAGRRRLLLAALGLLAVVVGAGTYSVARAYARELAVMRLQSEFVSAVSHEFRTPLTSLRQLSETLNEGRPLADERRAAYYQALDRSTNRLEKLVEGLLDFGRMESGAMVYRKQDLDVAALVTSVVDEYRREASDRGRQVTLKAGSDLPLIHADQETLGRAIWNLLDNAEKYSPGCPTIRVDVEREGVGIAIRVQDHGLGIPEAEQRDILRKFVRGTAADTTGIKGTGIGLAMVKHIVDAHGGSLRLESAPGEGSTFSIVLPAGG
ncbi:MAG: HAMP domain-containing histidine kinase [Vicinamibacterales bacterium]|nr:HAMP domain-containing histidine kinase [Vicinamibacterales bacterium]